MYRIRKLTPTECLRLMCVSDEDIQKLKDIGMSDTQMYKQAGNSICSCCVDLIFQHLYASQYNPKYICTDEQILRSAEIFDE